MNSQSFLHLGRWIAVLALLTTLCASSVTARSGEPASSAAPVPTASSIAPVDPPTTEVAAAAATLPTSGDTVPTTEPSTETPIVDRDELAGISMTSVPADVIVPTNEESLDEASNPINGHRGDRRPLPEEIDCAAGARACLTGVLDMLGFDVTGQPSDDPGHSLRRATAVVQLDAGLPMTGVPDDELLDYLGLATDSAPGTHANEQRQIGTSAKGRPIMATRYGDGPRTVLVVGQTHGDEEGGLRILLRVRSLSLPEEVTLWVIPTVNPDGLALDTRFLANGADPNRAAPSQLEQQAVYDFALAARPSLSIWYHQNYGWVGGSGASMVPARQYQALTGLGTLYRSGDCVVRGFLWCPIDDALGSSSILVELPDVLTPADVQIHAQALLAVASGNAP